MNSVACVGRRGMYISGGAIVVGVLTAAVGLNGCIVFWV